MRYCGDRQPACSSRRAAYSLYSFYSFIPFRASKAYPPWHRSDDRSSSDSKSQLTRFLLVRCTIRRGWFQPLNTPGTYVSNIRKRGLSASFGFPVFWPQIFTGRRRKAKRAINKGVTGKKISHWIHLVIKCGIISP